MTIDVVWSQLTGALVGGLVGGFSGFVANNLQRYLQGRRTTHNVACALTGEIDALRRRIRDDYLGKLEHEVNVMEVERRYPRTHFHGERDYSTIFHSMGPNIGLLAAELPRDLVGWYIGLGVCQERAQELHELTLRDNPDLLDYTIGVAQLQLVSFRNLVEGAGPLLDRLSRF